MIRRNDPMTSALFQSRCATALAWLLAAASAVVAGAEPTTQPDLNATFATAAGDVVRPLALGTSQKAAVFIFIATDCPISNSYAPTIAAFSKQFQRPDVRLYLVYCDADLHGPDVLKHQATYGLPGMALLDPTQQLAKTLGASVTPEAFIVGPGGAVLYDGPIDDQFAAVGRKRFAVTKPYLADGLKQVLAGGTVEARYVKPIGCAL